MFVFCICVGAGFALTNFDGANALRWSSTLNMPESRMQWHDQLGVLFVSALHCMLEVMSGC